MLSVVAKNGMCVPLTRSICPDRHLQYCSQCLSEDLLFCFILIVAYLQPLMLKPSSRRPKKYQASVLTADCRGAGTDSNVFVLLRGMHNGTQVDSAERKLHTSQNSNKFEQGSLDVFELEIPDLGELNQLQIWHDGSGIGYVHASAAAI